jgi:hypothetical protein
MPATSDTTDFSYATPASPDTADLTGATSSNSQGSLFSATSSGLQTLDIVITNILSDNKKIAFEPYNNQFTLSDGTTGYSALHYATEIQVIGLNYLDNVNITGTPADNEVLAYDTTSSKWINQTAAEANIVTSANPVITGTISGNAFLDEDDMSSNSAVKVASQQSIKAYVDSQVTAQDLDFSGDNGGAQFIDLDSQSLTLTGGTGIDTTGSAQTMTFAIDSTVVQKDATQTLTAKTLTTPVIASLKPSGSNTLTMPDATDTIVGRATTDTLTNKTLTTPVINGFSGTGNASIDGVLTTTGNIELGHASDNTLSASSGVLSIEGKSIVDTGGTGLTKSSSSSSTLNLDTNSLTEAAIADGDYIVFNDATDSNAPKKEALADVATLFAGTGLSASSSVLSVDASQTQITSVGTIGTGTWQGTAIADSYIASASTWNSKQAGDAALTSISGLTTAADKMIYTTGSDTYAVTDLTATARTLLDDASTSDMRTTLGVAIGTNVQAYDADLNTIAGLSNTDGNFIVGSGSAWVAESGSTARTSLGLGTSAILDSVDEDNMSSNSATLVPTQQSVKAYVDSVAEGLDVKDSAKVATTANITLANTQTIDGVSLSAGDRVLVKDQSTGSQNGVYVVVDGGSWTRATDFDSNTEVTDGTFFFVEQGTVNADSGWVLTTNNPITVGTTALVFSQFSGAGQITAGTGLSKSGNTLSVDASQTQITSVGTIGTGTWQGTAIADSYISSASTWNAKQAALTFGIANTNAVKIDDADAATNDYAKLTSSGIEGRSYAEVKSDLSLNNVENTALSTWAGSSNITTVGTLTSATIDGDVTFTGASYNVVWDKSDNALEFANEAKAEFGGGADIFVNSYGNTIFNITGSGNATGDLYLQNLNDDKSVFIRTDAGNGQVADYVKADGSTGEVILSHYGSQKLATKTTGVDITGALTTDGVTSDGAVNISGVPNVAQLTVYLTSATGYAHSIECYNPNMTQNQRNQIHLGESGSSYNTATLSYVWDSAGSAANNYLEIGHWSNGDLIKVYGDRVEITGPLTTTGTIEFGHASDTTISRVSAGVIAVEGKNLSTVDDATALAIALG